MTSCARAWRSAALPAYSPPGSRGAFARPGWSLSLRVHPKRGVGGAPTGALFCCRAGEARRSAPARCGASHDAGRSPLGAPPWRFSAGGRAPSLVLSPAPCTELLAARSSCLAGGVPGNPCSVRNGQETTANGRQYCSNQQFDRLLLAANVR